MKIYVASSWRCAHQPGVVELLRVAGHAVYDFRNPPSRAGFGWEQLERGGAESWSAPEFRDALQHPIAQAGFASDMGALRDCDACLLVLPCNRSAHLELGWACGAGKRTAVYIPEQKEQAELMYLMCDEILVSERELWRWAGVTS